MYPLNRSIQGHGILNDTSVSTLFYMIDQHSVRRLMLKKRGSLDEIYINNSQTLFNHKLLDFLRPFNSVGLYSAFRNEISVDSIFDSFLNKKLALPIINGCDEIEFVNYEDKKYWHRGKYGILEPNTAKIEFKPEIFVIPLTAIDYNGTRVGMGRGYYDKYLDTLSHKAILLGVGWDFQLNEDVIERNVYDKPLDYFLSPKFFIDFHKKTPN